MSNIKGLIESKSVNILVIIITSLIVTIFVTFKIFNLKIIINLTESLPHKAFILQQGKVPQKGDYVSFYKENRFYDKDFAKILVGTAGDVIEKREDEFWILSEEKPFLTNVGKAKKYSKVGEELEAISTGIIPTDHFYVYASHKDSLDSRYQDIGLIGSHQIKGVLLPIPYILELLYIATILAILAFIISVVRIYRSFLVKSLFCLSLFPITYQDLIAKDLGVHGKIYEVAETDLSQDIKDKLSNLEESNKLEELQKEWQQSAIDSIKRPKSFIDLPRAKEVREFKYDPSITANQDFYDHQGNIVVKKGTTVNPLNYYSLPQNLIFINGDDQVQVNWALQKAKDKSAIIILTKGNVIDLMKNHKTRFYFDQNGYLINSFKFKDSGERIIKYLPAQITQDDKLLNIREVPL